MGLRYRSNRRDLYPVISSLYMESWALRTAGRQALPGSTSTRNHLYCPLGAVLCAGRPLTAPHGDTESCGRSSRTLCRAGGTQAGGAGGEPTCLSPSRAPERASAGAAEASPGLKASRQRRHFQTSPRPSDSCSTVRRGVSHGGPSCVSISRGRRSGRVEAGHFLPVLSLGLLRRDGMCARQGVGSLSAP